jgi:Tfp pilus assembly protein FimT
MVVAVAALLAAVAARSGARALDAAAVRAAAAEVRGAFTTARGLAVLRAERTAVRLDSAGGAVVVHAGADTLRRLGVGARHGVRLAATRDSMAFAPPGIGHGAANLRVVLSRGRAADTVVVSRLGRVR